MAHRGAKQYNLGSVRPRIALITPMDTNKTEILYRDLSYKIVGLAMEVHRKLGYGFLEKVYENALMILFEREGVQARQQVPTKVSFEGKQVGYYVADIMVEGLIILEIKAAENLCDAHRAQTLNYLRATGLRLAILLNSAKESFNMSAS